MRRQSLIILLLVALITLVGRDASAATYKVRKGDSLARIAKKQHVSVEALREANGLESDALQVGTKLVIPVKGKAPKASDESKEEAVAPSSASGAAGTPPVKTESAPPVTEWAGYHTVRKGDTFATIARDNDLSVEALKRLNPGKKFRKLKDGMRLRVKVALETAISSAAPAKTTETAVAPPQPLPETHEVAKPSVAAVAPVPVETAAPRGSGPATHTVRKGDTFAIIAKVNNVSIDDLKRFNPGKDSRRLKIGMQLRVRPVADTASVAGPVGVTKAQVVEKPAEKPAPHPVARVEKAVPEPVAAEPSESAAASVPKPVYHKVRKGETYASIASKYGVSVKKLKKLNHIRKAKKLKPGSQLLVRGGSGGSTITADRRRELEQILQNEASLTAEGARLAAAQVTEMAPELLAAANDNAFEGGPIVEEQPPGLTGRVIRIAKLMLDLPYRFGGTSLTGIDCSGYVQKVFGFLNLPLPRTAREQFAKGEKIEKDELTTGDLVFFKTYARFPSHVGIYLGDNKFIHASSGDHKVKIDSLDAPYFLRRYIGARRLVADQKDEEE